MSRAEFSRWVQYYAQAPFDDLHRYHRPAALVSYSMAGGDLKTRIEWLLDAQPDTTQPHEQTPEEMIGVIEQYLKTKG